MWPSARTHGFKDAHVSVQNIYVQLKSSLSFGFTILCRNGVEPPLPHASAWGGVACCLGDRRQRQRQRPQRAHRASSQQDGAVRCGARRRGLRRHGASRCCTCRCGPRCGVRCGAVGTRTQVATDGHVKVLGECGEGVLDSAKVALHLVDVLRELAHAVLDSDARTVNRIVEGIQNLLLLGWERLFLVVLFPPLPLAL